MSFLPRHHSERSVVPAAYLASYVLSVLGNSIAAIALPLIVLQTTASALDVGIVAGATAIPAVAAGLLDIGGRRARPALDAVGATHLTQVTRPPTRTHEIPI